MMLAWPLFWLAIKGRLAFLATRPLVFLGTISYALYVLHLPLGHEIEHLLNAQNISAWIIIPTALTAAVATASLATFFIEKPAMRLIRHAYRSWRPGVTPARRLPLPAK